MNNYRTAPCTRIGTVRNRSINDKSISQTLEDNTLKISLQAAS